jgi:hypothetical protein
MSKTSFLPAKYVGFVVSVDVVCPPFKAEYFTNSSHELDNTILSLVRTQRSSRQTTWQADKLIKIGNKKNEMVPIIPREIRRDQMLRLNHWQEVEALPMIDLVR